MTQDSEKNVEIGRLAGLGGTGPAVCPTVTVIIPARPGQTDVLAASAAVELDYPRDRLEILVIRGTQPSAQRNLGIRMATGDLIYFLDDDSVPDTGNLRRALQWFREDSVAIVGGPSLCPAEAPFWERVFSVVMRSWLAFGPSRARYMQLGKPRPTSEKELILCNLLARKKAILEVGGFNESLYPNEENALMDEMSARGWKMIYDPALVVYRRPRRTVSAFVKMLFRYGRGRAEQFRVNPTLNSLPNLVPPLFCLYLACLPFLRIPFGGILLLYTGAILGQWLLLLRNTRFQEATAALPFIVLTHLVYGLGFWYGLFTKLHPPSGLMEFQVERICIPRRCE